MTEVLNKLEIFFDELDKIRILEPEIAQKTTDLKDECKIYVEREYFFGNNITNI